MKRKKKLYDTITFEYVLRVYEKQVRVNTKNKVKIRKFEDFYSINLTNPLGTGLYGLYLQSSS